jgi:protein-tyrosine phosphatase
MESKLAPTVYTPIRLVAPENDSVTGPLQRHIWDEVKESVVIESVGKNTLPERSLPEAVRFAWEPARTGANQMRFDLLLSSAPDFSHPIVRRDLSQASTEVRNLLLNTRYYWKVIQKSQQRPVAESPVWSFQTNKLPPRWIHVPGTSNVRDLGGWSIDSHHRVRQGMIYRSAELNTHTRLPADGVRVLVDELGIRTDLDLRGLYEESTSPALDLSRVFWVNARVQPYAEMVSEISQRGYRLAFKILADPARYPILIHCWGGADRTGTLAFLLNGLLGVRLSHLIHDYELTSLSVMGVRLHTSDEFQEFLTTLKQFARPRASIQEQVEGYLAEIGINDLEIHAIRNLLVETTG